MGYESSAIQEQSTRTRCSGSRRIRRRLRRPRWVCSSKRTRSNGTRRSHATCRGSRCGIAEQNGRSSTSPGTALSRAEGRLTIRFTRTPALSGELEPWQHDTFIARWKDRELRADAYVTFALNPDGSIDQAKMRAVSPATDFSFDFQDLLLRPALTPKS